MGATVEEVPRRLIRFRGANADTSYTIKVSLVLNGKSIATAQKSLKALSVPPTQAIQDAQNIMMASQLLQSVE